MKKKHVLIWVLCISMAVLLFVVASTGVKSPAESGVHNGIAGLKVLQFLQITTVLAVALGIIIVLFIFPAAGLLIALVRVHRHKRMNMRAMALPGVLILCSVALWNIWSLFVYGSGYYFHHDFGSKVYNETYIIPYYEQMYGDELELMEKKVIDSCNATYTLRSGITGKTFSVETAYYDSGGGVFEMLHLSANYSTILGERLLCGEEISLPFDEGHGIHLGEKVYCWLSIWNRNDNYEISISGGEKNYAQEFEGRAWGKRYFVEYENGILCLKIPVEKNKFSTHSFQLSDVCKDN